MNPYTRIAETLENEILHIEGRLKSHLEIYGHRLPDYEREEVASIIQQTKSAVQFARALHNELRQQQKEPA